MVFPFNSSLMLARAGGAGSAWNPADAALALSFSADNLTATNTNNLPSNVRGTLGHTSGKYHFEILSVTGGLFEHANLGVADATASLTAATGTNTHSIRVQDNGGVFFNGSSIGPVDIWTAGDTIALEVDLGTSQLWVQKVGGTGRKGPFSFSGIGAPVFPILATATNTTSATANFGASSFAISPTSGFSAWG